MASGRENRGWRCCFVLCKYLKVCGVKENGGKTSFGKSFGCVSLEGIMRNSVNVFEDDEN